MKLVSEMFGCESLSDTLQVLQELVIQQDSCQVHVLVPAVDPSPAEGSILVPVLAPTPHSPLQWWWTSRRLEQGHLLAHQVYLI